MGSGNSDRCFSGYSGRSAGEDEWEWHDLLDGLQSHDDLSAAEVIAEVRRIVEAAPR